MRLQSFGEVLLYLGLLVGALVFCWQNVDDYFLGSTGYISTQEPLTLRDIPTLTFCWEICKWEYCFLHTELIHGKDLIVDLKIVADNKEKSSH